MENKLKELESLINKKLLKENIIVSNISYVKENGYNVLKIELDKVNGIDLDTIVMASNLINPLVDEINFTDDSYILDIVSKEKGDGKNE
jgi:ribosome maturation factor RimP